MRISSEQTIAHPVSRRALEEQLEQETAARELAEALHAKKAAELEAMTRESLRLKALILGVHLSQVDVEGVALDDACLELEREGQRIHGCAGGACSSWPEFDPK